MTHPSVHCTFHLDKGHRCFIHTYISPAHAGCSINMDTIPMLAMCVTLGNLPSVPQFPHHPYENNEFLFHGVVVKFIEIMTSRAPGT